MREIKGQGFMFTKWNPCSLSRVYKVTPNQLVVSHPLLIFRPHVIPSVPAQYKISLVPTPPPPPPPPGSLSPFLTFSHVRILYVKNRRRGRAWYETPPTRGHLAKVLVATRSFVHCTALVLPSGPCLLH